MTSEEQHDPYDPEVAERFELLDGLEPPPLPTDGVSTIGDHLALAGSEPAVDRWRRYAMIGMAAAALATLVGLSAVALTRGGDQGVEANEVGQADGGGERSAGPIESTERPDSPSSTLNASTVTEGTPIVVDDASSDGQTGPSSTTSAATSPTTTETTVPTTVEEPSTDSTSGGDGGQVISIRGVVTEVFTDCQSRLVLNDDGSVEEVGPVSCDGGSHIIVDGRRIQTTSGFGLPEDAFDRHPRDLQPGESVVVTALSERNGRLSLDCDSCGVGR